MTIRDQIIGMIEAVKPAPAPVTETANLYTDLGFDSLAFVRLLVEIEEAQRVRFALLEMEMCLRVDRLIALVESKLKEAAHDTASVDPSGKPQ